MSNAHEHIEHAEHAEHAAHDPFDKRVAVSVAIVAAVLAGISMLGHRKHNEVLQLTTQANIEHTKATDAWGEYQAVNIRDHGYEFASGVLKEVAKAEPKYAEGFKTYTAKADDQHKKYKKRLPTMQEKAINLGKEAENHIETSHYAHEQATRLDYGHLAAEFGIVLCSLALLTKKKLFWYAGLASTVVALALTVTAYALPHESHESHDSTASHPTPGQNKETPAKGH
jgi:hypothetical protein